MDGRDGKGRAEEAVVTEEQLTLPSLSDGSITVLPSDTPEVASLKAQLRAVVQEVLEGEGEVQEANRTQAQAKGREAKARRAAFDAEMALYHRAFPPFDPNDDSWLPLYPSAAAARAAGPPPKPPAPPPLPPQPTARPPALPSHWPNGDSDTTPPLFNRAHLLVPPSQSTAEQLVLGACTGSDLLWILGVLGLLGEWDPGIGGSWVVAGPPAALHPPSSLAPLHLVVCGPSPGISFGTPQFRAQQTLPSNLHQGLMVTALAPSSPLGAGVVQGTPVLGVNGQCVAAMPPASAQAAVALALSQASPTHHSVITLGVPPTCLQGVVDAQASALRSAQRGKAPSHSAQARPASPSRSRHSTHSPVSTPRRVWGAAAPAPPTTHTRSPPARRRGYRYAQAGAVAAPTPAAASPAATARRRRALLPWAQHS